MAEGASDVGAPEGPEPEELEHEVEDIRGNIDHIVTELNRRRHDTFDWRLQLRKHSAVVGAVLAGLFVATGGTIGWSVWRSRRRARPMAKAKRLRDALGRMIEHPEWVARPHPTVGKKALGGAASAVAAAVAKRAAQRLLDRVEAPRVTYGTIEATGPRSVGDAE